MSADVSLPLVGSQAPKGDYIHQNNYLIDDTKFLCPSGLVSEREVALQALALKAFRVVGCLGWGRVDLMLNRQGRAFLLEVNTVPGMTDHSLVPKAARAVGMSYEDLCLRILEAAHVG